MREKFDDTKIQAELKNLNGWEYNNGAIEKNFVFKNFKEALAMMVRIGFEAEKMNHHPAWMNVYNKLNVRLNTHDAGGITERDFVLAKKIDEVIENKM
ncbi:MAG: 4a-hydroxytetrahydrobiopterin dehydratase [Bacteroidetes bacterium]|nr:4a-hydroxytetrahydrobiopterin dehydratase [Bacteroidota bacterium]